MDQVIEFFHRYFPGECIVHTEQTQFNDTILYTSNHEYLVRADLSRIYILDEQSHWSQVK
mgnify:CR=1 FL=1